MKKYNKPKVRPGLAYDFINGKWIKRPQENMPSLPELPDIPDLPKIDSLPEAPLYEFPTSPEVPIEPMLIFKPEPAAEEEPPSLLESAQSQATITESSERSLRSLYEDLKSQVKPALAKMESDRQKRRNKELEDIGKFFENLYFKTKNRIRKDAAEDKSDYSFMFKMAGCGFLIFILLLRGCGL